MDIYRFFVLDVGGRISLGEDWLCMSDRAALARARALAETYAEVAVWRDGRPIGVLPDAESWGPGGN
jgi:hypothetical protein